MNLNNNAENFINLFNKEQTITSPEAFTAQPSLKSQMSEVPNTLQVIKSTPKYLIQSDSAMPNDQNRFGFSATAQLSPTTSAINNVASKVEEENLMAELKTEVKDTKTSKQDYAILNPIGKQEETSIEPSSLTDTSLLSNDSSESSVNSESSESNTKKSSSLSNKKSKSSKNNLNDGEDEDETIDIENKNNQSMKSNLNKKIKIHDNIITPESDLNPKQMSSQNLVQMYKSSQPSIENTFVDNEDLPGYKTEIIGNKVKENKIDDKQNKKEAKGINITYDSQ